jgi:hypothetical protein
MRYAWEEEPYFDPLYPPCFLDHMEGWLDYCSRCETEDAPPADER